MHLQACISFRDRHASIRVFACIAHDRSPFGWASRVQLQDWYAWCKIHADDTNDVRKRGETDGCRWWVKIADHSWIKKQRVIHHIFIACHSPGTNYRINQNLRLHRNHYFCRFFFFKLGRYLWINDEKQNYFSFYATIFLYARMELLKFCIFYSTPKLDWINWIFDNTTIFATE